MPPLTERVARAIFYARYASGPMVIDGEGHQLRLASVADLPDGKWDSERDRWIECATRAIEVARPDIETLFRQWWKMDCRHGMTESEAVASFFARIDAASKGVTVDG